MVSSQSAAAASENDKRRKVAQQTMEKVKANHLSRQLQMRLQYARLKVEHGWQKQNLNEVENLYFHNSHQRGPKPFIASTPAIITTQQQSSAFPNPQSAPAQSSLSFKLGPSTLGRSSVVADFPMDGDAGIDGMSQEELVADAVASHPAPVQDHADHEAVSVTINDPPTSLDAPSDTPMTLATDLQLAVASSSSPSTEAPPGSINPPIIRESTPIPLNTEPTNQPTDPNSPHDDTQSPDEPTFTSNHYPAIKPVRSRAHRLPAGPKGTHQNLTPKDMLAFSSASNLTYDSFWSSHNTGPATAATAPRPSRGSITEFTPAFQMPMNLTPPNGTPEPHVQSANGSSSFIPPTSISATLAAPNLDQPRCPGPSGPEQ